MCNKQFLTKCSAWITIVKLRPWNNLNLNFELELCVLLYGKIYNRFIMNRWRPRLSPELAHLFTFTLYWSLKPNKFRNSNFKWLFILWMGWWPLFYTIWPNNIQFIFHLKHIIVKSTQLTDEPKPNKQAT